jgi:hypothetical protein
MTYNLPSSRLLPSNNRHPVNMAMMITMASVVVVVASLRRKTEGNQSYQGDGETDHHVSPGCTHRKSRQLVRADGYSREERSWWLRIYRAKQELRR